MEKCEASGCRQSTYVLARRVLRSRSWRALRTLWPGESHIAAPRWASWAGQGRASWTQGAAGLARVWRPALVPPLVPRTSQWRAVPSHALGCLAPEVAGAGTEGLGGDRPRAATEGLPGAACGGRTHAWLGDPRTGTSCRCATQDFVGSSEDSAPFLPDCKHTPMDF